MPDRVVFHSFCRSISVERVAWNGGFGGSLPSTAVLFVCMPDNRENKRIGKFFLRLCCFFLGDYMWEGRGAGISLLSAATLLVYVPTDLKDECAERSFLLRFCR